MHLLAAIPAGLYASLLPEIAAELGLTHGEAGLVEGAFQFGYLLASPLLLALSDRHDAKRIFAWSALLSSLASLGMAFLASSLPAAATLRFLAGIGLAGVYMPGLRVLTDRLPTAAQARSVAFYTATFSASVAVATFLAGTTSGPLTWRGSFTVAGVLAMASAALALTIRPAKVAERTPWREILDLRPALRNRDSRAYSLAYAAHTWELFGFRAWLVTFLFAVAARSDAVAGEDVRFAASAILLLGLPASLIGSEACLRFGRRRVLTVIMSCSAAMACAVPHLSASFAGAALVCGIYSLLVSADSGALTSGALQAAAGNRQGTTLAVHSVFGFLAASLSPPIVGGILDLGEGQNWGSAFLCLAAGVMLGPLFLRLGRAERSDRRG